MTKASNMYTFHNVIYFPNQTAWSHLYRDARTQTKAFKANIS